MKSIEELRKDINAIDKDMALLFSKRMKIVSSIRKLKKELNLPTYDKDREKKVIEENIKYVHHDYQEFYLEFINKTLELSKQLQNKGQ